MHDEQAAFVRQIFVWCGEEGLPLRSIARRLATAHIPSPSGRPWWNVSSVRKLLGNHAYRGIAYGNQQQMIPARRRRPLVKPGIPGGSGYSVRRRPPEEWIGVAVPALISDRLFARVQERLVRNRQWSSRHTRHPYLLRCLVSCGRCSLSHMIWTNGRGAFYSCPGTAKDVTRGRPEVCHAPRIATHRLDAAVWDDLCRVLTDPTILAESLRQAHQGWLDESPRAGERQVLQRREAELRRQIDRLVDGYAAGALTLEELQARRGRLDARLGEVRRVREALLAAQEHDWRHRGAPARHLPRQQTRRRRAAPPGAGHPRPLAGGGHRGAGGRGLRGAGLVRLPGGPGHRLHHRPGRQ